MDAWTPSRRALVRLGSSMLAVVGALSAQTYVVDAHNGPGTNFTDLPAAIAAVPSGATLHVRAGDYAAFRVSGKSLTIVGHADPMGAIPTVYVDVVTTAVTIGALGSSDAVTLSNLAIGTKQVLPAVRLDLVDCQGSVVLDDVSMVGTALSDVNITGCSNVHIRRFDADPTITQGIATSATVTIDRSSVELSALNVRGYTLGGGLPALEVSNGSHVVAVDCDLVGGGGLFATDGGPGALVEGGSTLHMFGNVASGETVACQGGPGFASFGGGGDGLVLQNGSFARVHGFVLAGGQGSPAGQPFVVDTSSTLDYDPNDITPVGLLAGSVQPGASITYSLFAQPGRSAGLLVGLAPQLVMLPAIELGALGLQPIVALPIGTVPASGNLQLPSKVPASWPDDTVVLAQFLVFDASHLAASNVFMVSSHY